MQYTIHSTGDLTTVVAWVGGEVKTADTKHPNFDALVEGLTSQTLSDEEALELFDVAKTVANRFERLSDRYTVLGGVVYFDGVEVHNVLTRQVIRFLDAGLPDWKPLVAFGERVAANPTQHSRENLMRWLEAEDFSITPDGLIVGYKYVNKFVDGEGVTRYRSTFRGYGIVDGVVVENGYLEPTIGSIVEMPRDKVTHDPSVGCAAGLHVGTWGYAGGHTTVLEVHVDPVDVVSVPTEAGGQKMRTRKYKVIREVTQKYEAPVVDDNYDDLYDDDDYYDDDLGY